MPEVIVDTSPLQYLHQLRLLHVLPALASRIVVPRPVVDELEVGRASGVDVPDLNRLEWVTIRVSGSPRLLQLLYDLDMGEAAVLALALEVDDPVVVIDDRLGRTVASALGIPLRGTLGILLDAKKKGLVQALAPCIRRLDELGFRVNAETARTVLRMAGEV
ncbi:MAG: hypothetical protein A3K19_07970 [Lentisphaerae bacterium RIFOXYB12_FULL_65_16]|nr:MAG: hypothetical protein A3K18_08860 [Lentisphaerae bacterium RIFOXYA12_64_32]OGV87584.1 MAG: hypothetical protein A3K19_07970 [Lentisphaerae bacterium RIFOXYB12_FULL_65_16]